MHRRIGSWGLQTGFETPRRGGAKNGEIGVRLNASWNGLSQISCIAQMIFGVLLFATASWYLTAAGKTSGQVIGGASLLIGAIGLLGTANQKPQFQTLFIVGMGCMALLTFEFVGQVGRDMEVHCNFAESYVRLAHLEESVVSMNKEHVVEQLFARLNELDDMMDMVSEGTVHLTEMRAAQEDLKKRDREYIEGKVAALHRHAEAVMEHVYAKAKALEEEHKGDPQKIAEQKMARTVLEGHLNNVEKVLEHLSHKKKSGEGLTYGEYEMLYNALKDGHPDKLTMKAEQEHLPHVQASFERTEKDEYHELDLTNKWADMDKIFFDKEEARKLFEAKMSEMNKASATKDKQDFEKSLMASLSDLPVHCLSEVSHYQSMKWGGWALMLSQLMAAYVAATSLVVGPKHD